MKKLLIFALATAKYISFWIQFFVLCLVPRRFRKKKDIIGQTVLITGAGNGVGRELAIEFSKHSVCLILLDIHINSLRDTEKLLDSRSRSFVYYCDVSNPQKVNEVADKIKSEVGNVNILVNNAGIVVGKHLLELSAENIIKTMNVNVLAHFWMCKAFLPSMMERNEGHIVNVVSLMGKFTLPKLTDYCASKFAAIGFSESLEMELRDLNLDGIKVTVVCPSHVDTELFKGAKLKVTTIMSPRYVAEEIVAGLLEDEEIIYLPHLMRCVMILKESIPRWLAIWFTKKSGDIKLMENFVGRKENAESPKYSHKLIN